MDLSSPLFSLPRELRDKIYKYYVTIPGGYKYDFHRNKLIPADNKPAAAHFALMYTCTLIAYEMRGVALKYNTITFSTVYSADLRLLAGRFEYVLNGLYFHKEFMLGSSLHFITEDNTDEIAKKLQVCPELIEPLEVMKPVTAAKLRRFIKRTAENWKIEYSSFHSRQTKQTVLRILSQIPGFDSPRTAFQRRLQPGENVATVDWAPWMIPDEKELDRMSALVYGDSQAEKVKLFWSQLYDRSKWRFSATAAAIRFLGSVTKAHRDSMRQILILEDREAVADQACHALGLIPFCKDHPKLRIERRVSLWRNILLGDNTEWSPFTRATYDGKIRTFGVRAEAVPALIARWLQPTRRLIRDGMPPASFQLTIDGESASEMSCEIFQLVQKRAAWAIAYDEACRRKLINDGPVENGHEYIAALHDLENGSEYMAALQDLASERSTLVRCNFQPGISLDVEEIIRENHSFDKYAWLRVGNSFSSGCIVPTPALPPIEQLRGENIVEDKEYDQRKWVREQEEDQDILGELEDAILDERWD